MAADDGTAVRLYAAKVHRIGRAVGSVAAFITVLGVLAALRDAYHARSATSLMASLAFGLFGYAAASSLLRAKRVYGTSLGIVVEGRHEAQAIPWSRVSRLEYSVTAVNPVLRTFYVEIDERDRVYFFAGKRERLAWDELRRAAVSTF